ncbi:GTPase ERA1, chloroplastic isoform X1 [Selaginella moellendorffii]|uniref:GTPase ERA1, chloroplastic isoform X1 n=2 Tax=Selaginella moellendorffii TaxID=88036 RepID=UPI000D1C8245|nr:GTPase ERA1, chloroplastic isoform X1 [Selaginella moellendorffii]|eukprot:XP_002960801.2 GTPase ERA1, chloroplastic isoform X1 [Selaginella moellendorffii]
MLAAEAFASDGWRFPHRECGFPRSRRTICCVAVRAAVREEDDQEKPQEKTIFVLSEKPNRRAAVEEVVKRANRESLADEIIHQEEDGENVAHDDMKVAADHRSGYVALIGKPNVGKSTLLNGIIGQKLSIVTAKPQTTRHRILGICSGPNYQMILYDTPGVITKQMHKLDELMMKSVRSATINSDCLLLIADICHPPEQVLGTLDEGAVNLIKSKPTLLVLNKKDKVKQSEIQKKQEWYEKNSGMDEVIPVSAKFGLGIEEVKQWLVSKLPLGPAYYPRDIVSEHQERFFVSEIFREKIFQLYREEIPYCSQVNVVRYVEREAPAKDFIEIEILVEKESQKAILLGKEGKALKTLATAARLDIEDFVDRKCYLEIKVKVKEDWRKNEELLEHFGYSGKIASASL